MKMRRLLHAHSELVSTLHRTENAMGREWLVVPTVMVREMVLANELLPFDELIPPVIKRTWEGKPFMIGHPRDDEGHLASAGLMAFAESAQAGRMQNVDVDGTLRALIGESWIDLARSAEIDQGDELVQLIEDDQVVENSTSYFARITAAQGVFGGVPFTGIQRNMEPDHHAAVMNGQGRCSIEDGCGLQRVNVDDQVLEILDARANGRGRSMVPVTGNVEGLSHGDLRDLLRTAISEAEGSPDDFGPWVRDVFDDRVIYEASDTLWERNYSVDDDFNVTLGDRQEVVQTTDYVPVDNAPAADAGRVNREEGSGDMNRDELIRRLAANEACPHNEQELGAYSDPHLTALAGVYLEEPPADGGEGGRANQDGGCPDGTAAGPDGGDQQTASPDGGGPPAADPQAAPAANAIPEADRALIERVVALGEEGVTALESIVENSRQNREQTISSLVENQECPLERADLEAMSDAALQRLDAHYAPSGPQDWSGLGTPVGLDDGEDSYLARSNASEGDGLFSFAEKPAEA